MHKKLIIYIAMLIPALMLSGCSDQTVKKVETEHRYAELEEAIAMGLEEERADQNKVLYQEDINGETVVIFQSIGGSIGLATLYNNDGWMWFRSNPFYDISGDFQQTHSSFTITSENEQKLNVLFGKVQDARIKEVSVKINEHSFNLPVIHKGSSRYYLYVTPDDMKDVKVTPST